MKYAVIKLQGHQYKVSEGDEILVDKTKEDRVGAQVLLLVDGDKVALGTPLVEKAKVALKVLKAEEKGEKVDVYKFKAKSRYKKHVGFRPVYTRLQVEKISAS